MVGAIVIQYGAYGWISFLFRRSAASSRPTILLLYRSFCGAPRAIFASVVNLRTLSHANTAIARNDRYKADIFNFLGAEVNPDYCVRAVNRIFEGELGIGVGENVSADFRHEDPDESGYRTRKEAFCAGIDGANWKDSREFRSPRLPVPCEQLMLETRDWSLQNSSYRDAYELGRGLSYLFFQLDTWGQPLEVAEDLRKRLRHHSVHHVTEGHRQGVKARYGPR